MGGKGHRIKRGEVVHPWGSTIAICTSDPYEDPVERKRQVAYWLQRHGVELPESGKLVNVVFLKFDEEGNLVMGSKEYVFPVEMIRFRGVERFKREFDQMRAEKNKKG
jgi:hypothetical protein